MNFRLFFCTLVLQRVVHYFFLKKTLQTIWNFGGKKAKNKIRDIRILTTYPGDVSREAKYNKNGIPDAPNMLDCE